VKLWFSRDKDISIRDQLTTQLMLGIVTGELPPGARLPSTRALARRFKLHPNTVSAVYRQLEQQRWVESVRGSGVYVRGAGKDTREARMETLDHLALDFVRSARHLGVSAAEVRRQIETRLEPIPRYFAFVHDEAELRQIICMELKQQIHLDVFGCDIDQSSVTKFGREAILLTMPSKELDVLELLAPGQELISLEIAEVAPALARYMQYRKEILVTIASRWSGFLHIARTMLTAAGYPSDGLLFRDASQDEWKRGLPSDAVVVCDVVTSVDVPEGLNKIVFRLLSDACIAELKSCERFFAGSV
jgi:DNA-binding transcriptional regulator YhcF (GntR family)